METMKHMTTKPTEHVRTLGPQEALLWIVGEYGDSDDLDPLREAVKEAQDARVALDKHQAKRDEALLSMLDAVGGLRHRDMHEAGEDFYWLVCSPHAHRWGPHRAQRHLFMRSGIYRRVWKAAERFRHARYEIEARIRDAERDMRARAAVYVAKQPCRYVHCDHGWIAEETDFCDCPDGRYLRRRFLEHRPPLQSEQDERGRSRSWHAHRSPEEAGRHANNMRRLQALREGRITPAELLGIEPAPASAA